MEEMVAATRTNEPDTLAYQWSVSEDGKTCHIVERDKNSDAVMTHMGAFGPKFANRFMSAMTPKRLTIYGNPDETVKKTMGAYGAVYMPPIGGFTR